MTFPAKPLVISMGEPAGIGPELVVMSWQARQRENLPPFAYLGDPGDLGARARGIGMQTPIKSVGIDQVITCFSDSLPVIPLKLVEPSVPGTPDSCNAPQIITAIKQGVDLARGGAARALVTNPIQKASLYEAGFTYPGHTEFLGSLAADWPRGVDQPPPVPVMMLACDRLRVVPATVHVPLRDIPGMLTSDMLIRTALVVERDLRVRFHISEPRIAFAGLNPHAGERGAMGNEDIDIISPAIENLQRRGLNATGPFPADTLFHEAARSNYDVVIAMYHDQALIPIKTIAFDHAVNVTLGLPFVRTSPDHGTALNIAGRGIASPASLIAAIRMADKLSTDRAS